METLLIGLTAAIAAAFAVAFGQERARRREARLSALEHIGRLDGHLERALDRMGELERQVDSMHQRGMTIEPRPDPAEPDVPLPAEIQKHLDALDDPEAIEDFAELAALELDKGKPADRVARELFETEVEG